MKNTMHHRRGMLLLLVLSVLTLFLMMGATLLVVATRARTASRGFMAAANSQEGASPIPRAMLDEALLLLIRGSKETAVQAILTESLLKDMYASDNNKVPFREEPFDAAREDSVSGVRFDPYLTELEEDGSVHHAAFHAAEFDPESGDAVDNDADGVMDGMMLKDVLPKIMGAGGGELSFRVSYLVVDLDGRINVNAHGGGGNPVGPASLSGSAIDAFADNRWTVIQDGGTPTDPAGSNDLRVPPVLGQDIAGRGGSAYAIRLDREAQRPGTLTGAAGQNPFTLGELERVLRPFDRDWSALPPRLAAILTDLDNSARRMVTTDSWDVPYRVGAAAPTGAGVNPEPRFDLSSFAVDDKENFANALYTNLTTKGDPAKMPAADGVTAQWCANVAEFRDPTSGATAVTIGATPYTGAKPSVLGGAGGDWANGITNSGDLFGIPKGTEADIAAIIAENPPVTPLISLAVDHPAILEAVGMPSPFTASLAQDDTREPGRVNANTCSGDVWNALTGPDGPVQPTQLMRNVGEIIMASAFTGAGGFVAPDVRALDRTLANRFAAAATVRSNVFAIWITLEVTDGASTAGSPTCHRLFAIVDRSIPVDYVEGENKNVSETIRLKRFLN